MQRVVIKQQMSPKRKAFWAISFVLIVLGLMGVSFLAGHIYSGQIARVTSNNSFLATENTRLSDLLKQRDNELVELRDRTSVAENELHLQKLTTEEMKKLLDEETRKKMLLEKELGFYRKVSKKKQPSTFNLREFEFKPIQQGGQLNYKFTLAKVKKSNDKVSGKVKLLIKGKIKDKTAEITIPGQGEMPMKYGFKVFQGFEGAVDVPEGFKASSVSIAMISESNGRTVFERSYDWQDVYMQ